jgi:uncharacterized protein (TIGR03435 family)
MAEIAAALGNTAAGQPVVDRTGLTGVYDFELRWAADAQRRASVSPTTVALHRAPGTARVEAAVDAGGDRRAGHR